MRWNSYKNFKKLPSSFFIALSAPLVRRFGYDREGMRGGAPPSVFLRCTFRTSPNLLANNSGNISGGSCGCGADATRGGVLVRVDVAVAVAGVVAVVEKTASGNRCGREGGQDDKTAVPVGLEDVPPLHEVSQRVKDGGGILLLLPPIELDRCLGVRVVLVDGEESPPSCG